MDDDTYKYDNKKKQKGPKIVENFPLDNELEDSAVAPSQVVVTQAQEFCLEAHCLLNGHGIGQHTDDALDWYRQSIDKGEPKGLLAMA